MKIVIIGAAPTGLGAAYRIFEMQNEGNITAKKADIIVLEKVCYKCHWFDQNFCEK